MEETICPFGARLKELREKVGLNKSETARKSGLSRGALTRLERGLHSPDGDTVDRLAAALGVRREEFRCPDWVLPRPGQKFRR